MRFWMYDRQIVEAAVLKPVGVDFPKGRVQMYFRDRSEEGGSVSTAGYVSENKEASVTALAVATANEVDRH